MDADRIAHTPSETTASTDGDAAAADGAAAPETQPALALVAALGSVSYGVLSARRLAAVLRGGEAADAEMASIYQALSESELHSLATLARELDLPFDVLDARAKELFGKTLREMRAWTLGSAS